MQDQNVSFLWQDVGSQPSEHLVPGHFHRAPVSHVSVSCIVFLLVVFKD